MSAAIQSMSAESLLKLVKHRRRRRWSLMPGELARRKRIQWQEFQQRSDERARKREVDDE